MWNTVKDMLKSKKALAALVACAVWIAGRFGLDLDKETLLGAVTPLWLYVLGQGVADMGKEAKKLEAPKA